MVMRHYKYVFILITLAKLLKRAHHVHLIGLKNIIIPQFNIKIPEIPLE